MENISIQKIMDLKGKTAFVTGGAMGIGKGIAYRLAEAGANVLLIDLNEEIGKNTEAEMNEKGFNVSFFKADVSEEEQVINAINFGIEKFGNVNILVNNAGIYPLIPILKMDTKEFEKIINVNLKSAFIFTKIISEIMIKQGNGGKIINITSIDALHPSAVGLAVYDTTKHGLWGFTKNTALELAPHGISVNAIAPGSISTPGTGDGTKMSPEMKEISEKFIQKIPMKRKGDIDDIGKVALFLASDLSSYMTGAQIVVDGGVLLS
ncbi:SDR family oxidoreductase [Candidatus Nomurabacteria bacterium]|nr:SDR family oxidoreductase [Candidatus Nomurabacteria bacterium]